MNQLSRGFRSRSFSAAAIRNLSVLGLERVGAREGRPIEVELAVGIGELLEELGATGAISGGVAGQEPQHGVDVPVVAAALGQVRRFPLEDAIQQLAGFLPEPEVKVLVGDVEPGVVQLVASGAVVGLIAESGLHVAQRGRPLAVGTIEPQRLPVERAQGQACPARVEPMADVVRLLDGQGFAGGEGLRSRSSRPRRAGRGRRGPGRWRAGWRPGRRGGAGSADLP